MDNQRRNSTQIRSDQRLLELTDRNPSLGGRELVREIIERDSIPDEYGRPHPGNIHAALRSARLDDPDYRTPVEQADWIGRESKLMRDLYEHGVKIKGDVLIIPAEEHELNNDRETPFITTLSYALGKIKNAEKAIEFHALAKKISGETADARTEIVVFKTYFDRITRDERGNPIKEGDRTRILSQTLSEMWKIAAEVEKLETRESIEPDRTEALLWETDERSFNESSRKVRLNEETLRFPSGLTQDAKERLITTSIPEIDRRLEDGMTRVMLHAAIDGGANRRLNEDGQELTEDERSERFEIGVFLKRYIDERLRDPETRELNSSPEFRQARMDVFSAKTPEALSRISESFLRSNKQRSDAFRAHLADPIHYPIPAQAPLNAQQRNLLFYGRSPAHFSPEMRDLRIAYGLSRTERAEHAEKLRQGLLTPSPPLEKLLEEFESRQTVKAINHFQANLLTPQMRKAGNQNLNQYYERIPPHERKYLYELTENRKQALLTSGARDHPPKTTDRSPGRALGASPTENRTLREYLASMGEIERRLLNTEVGRSGNAVINRDDPKGLTITEARSFLPESRGREIRTQARTLAWERIFPTEIIDRNPSPEILGIQESIDHVREYLQEKARIAQTARNEFLAEKSQFHNNRPNGSDARLTSSMIDRLSPEDARQFEALDHYASQMRETVYREFEKIDLQRRDLEAARLQSESRQTAGTEYHGAIELDPSSSPTEADRFLSPGKNLVVDRFSVQGFIDSEQEWHVDTLRDALQSNDLMPPSILNERNIVQTSTIEHDAAFQR